MDYRERKYFLLYLFNYNYQLQELKSLVPSIEFHKPYNHFRKGKVYNKLRHTQTDIFDSEISGMFAQQMISCRIKDVEKLENYFTTHSGVIRELTKENLGQ